MRVIMNFSEEINVDHVNFVKFIQELTRRADKQYFESKCLFDIKSNLPPLTNSNITEIFNINLCECQESMRLLTFVN